MTPTETWESLALLLCKGTCAQQCSMSRPAGLCKDCLRDGQPTNLMFPGLTERCPCLEAIPKLAKDEPGGYEAICGGACIDGEHGDFCRRCHGSGRTLLQGPALLVAALGIASKHLQYLSVRWTSMGFWEAWAVIGVDTPEGYAQFMVEGPDIPDAMLEALRLALAAL